MTSVLYLTTLDVLFYLASAFLLISSVVVILAKNPMTSILSMVFTFVNASIIFVLLRAEFIAMVMLVVYVGAIAVLFIFVIMLLDVKNSEKRKIFTKNFIFGLAICFVILIETITIFANGHHHLSLPSINNSNHINNDNVTYQISNILYNNYGIMVLLIGILLSVVVVGVIYINHKLVVAKRQSMFDQVSRDSKTAVYTIKIDNEQGIKR